MTCTDAASIRAMELEIAKELEDEDIERSKSASSQTDRH